MKKVIAIFSFSAIFAIAIVGVLMHISYSNKEIRLRNQYEAEVKNVEGIYDNMWKIISQQAQITQEYEESFREIYKDIMSGRYSGTEDGSLMKWVTEANPEFDIRLYDQLMNTVEVQRTKFLNAQTKIVDICRVQNNLIDLFPSSIFLSGREKLTWEEISSNRAKQVMETRTDDDIEMFNHNKS